MIGASSQQGGFVIMVQIYDQGQLTVRVQGEVADCSNLHMCACPQLCDIHMLRCCSFIICTKGQSHNYYECLPDTRMWDCKTN